jgi:hypothetical protein
MFKKNLKQGRFFLEKPSLIIIITSKNLIVQLSMKLLSMLYIIKIKINLKGQKCTMQWLLKSTKHVTIGKNSITIQ